MERKDDGTIEIDLLHILQVFWKKAWFIVLMALLCGVLGFCYSTFRMTPKYQSKVLVYVNNQTLSFGSSSVSISSQDITASQSLVDTYIVILKTRKTLNEVIKRANLDKSYESLSDMVSAAAVNETEVFTITVTSSNPYEAELIVNTIADVLPEKIAEVVEGSSAKIVDYGVVNTNKVSPVRTKYAAIGVLIGAVIACGILVVLDLMNDLIQDESYLERYKIPILAVIPDLLGASAGKKYGKKYYDYNYKYKYDYSYDHASAEKKDEANGSRAAKNAENRNDGISNSGTGFFICEKLPFVAAEAYKLLRTNLMFVLPDEQKCRIVGVTSSFRSEGKSITSLNLSYTLSKTDKKVLLIEGDMRLPSLSRKMPELKVSPGLSNVLAGLSTCEEAIQHSVRSQNWDILAAGDLPPNPAELLGSDKMRDLLSELSQTYDWIVVDLPPADIVSDALALTASLTGILVVVRRNYTDKQSLKDCMNKLDLVKANVAGFVVTDADIEHHSYGKYGRYGRKNRYGTYRRKGYQYDSHYYSKGYGKDSGYGYEYGDSSYGYGNNAAYEKAAQKAAEQSSPQAMETEKGDRS